MGTKKSKKGGKALIGYKMNTNHTWKKQKSLIKKKNMKKCINARKSSQNKVFLIFTLDSLLSYVPAIGEISPILNS